MKANTDRTAYAEAFLDTPFSAPRNPSSREEAFHTPGCHVKTREKAPNSKWPKAFGRLVSIENDVVTVISKPPMHDGDMTPTVWTGSIPEYHKMWECD